LPKLTPEERAELEAKLAADDDDDDFEFNYSEEGRSISLPWSKREALAEFGFKGSPKKPEPKKDAADKDAKVSRFDPARRRTS
jgi:hypothetical protein